MTATVDNAVADLQRTIEELQRQLDECRAERDEAFQRETATAEVLGVINSLPGDLAAVFDAMLERACRLCEPAFGGMLTWDGEFLQPVAWRGVPPEQMEAARGAVIPPPGGPGYRLVHGESVVRITDLAAEEIIRDMPVGRLARAGGRSYVAVALRKDDRLLGVIAIYRREVRPFTDKEVALLQNFAAQAVIAMENARLITETREALEQQTATAEVLQVINSSPGDLAPVFDAMLDKAMALCVASFGGLSTYDGERFSAVATRGLPPALVDFVREPYAVGPESYHGQLVGGAVVLHVTDLAAENFARSSRPLGRPGVERGRAFVDLGNARTGLFLALRIDDVLLGSLWFYRQEVRPFSEKQIALLQNFAAQAVIAMENARLITETREALEQQTATAEVLQVINSSPGDLTPVFYAILEKAHALCESGHGTLFLREGEHFRAAAMRGVPEPLSERLQQGQLGLDAPATLPLLAGEPFVHITDLAGFDHPLVRVALAGGVRTLLSVPLRKGDALIGLIVAARFEAQPFTDKQIALLQNFAAQAVIAMENAADHRDPRSVGAANRDRRGVAGHQLLAW